MQYAPQRRQFFFPLWPLALLAVFPGCGPAAPKNDTSVPSPKRETKQDTVPRKLESEKITVRWRERAPQGGIRPLMDIWAEAGTLQSSTQSGILQKTRGILYRNGHPVARFTAPQVEAYRDQNRVMALGGVVVTSIDPPHVTLKAYSITWYIDRDTIVARGSCRMALRPRDASQPTAEGRAEQITIDTKMERFSIP
ncbi:MAG TPA: hypothetical protein VNJ09_10190 [Chthonomonadales bacterium]|nr:hypothetical protein [Chthonomonadales bacterium]